jgi:hypothetical protein
LLENNKCYLEIRGFSKKRICQNGNTTLFNSYLVRRENKSYSISHNLGEKIMLIQDLNHVEMISEETHLEGGLALGYVATSAGAYGSKSAKTNSVGATLASSNQGCYYSNDFALAGGASSAVAFGCGASAGSGVEALAIAG